MNAAVLATDGAALTVEDTAHYVKRTQWQRPF